MSRDEVDVVYTKRVDHGVQRAGRVVVGEAARDLKKRDEHIRMRMPMRMHMHMHMRWYDRVVVCEAAGDLTKRDES